MATYTEQLAEVRTAISSVLTNGQYVAADGLKWQQADLETLRKMEKDLIAKVAMESGASSVFDRTLYQIPRRI